MRIVRLCSICHIHKTLPEFGSSETRCRACSSKKPQNPKDAMTPEERRKNNSKNQAVRRLTRKMIASGEIVKKSNCETCGSPSNLEVHHEDYSKPEWIITLCRICHGRLHIRKKYLARIYKGFVRSYTKPSSLN